MAEGNSNNQAARPCPRDCRLCGMTQQVYCSTQMCFNMFEMLNGMAAKIESVEHTVEVLKSKSEELAAPPKVIRGKKHITQNGDGEEVDAPR